MSGNEIVHFMKHAASQEKQDTRLVYWGHLSSYNPQDNTVKVLIPSLVDANGNMYETGSTPLGTIVVGNNWGLQLAPIASATPSNLLGGEQVQFVLHDRKSGVGAITKMAFNQNMSPPGGGGTNNTTTEGDPNGDNQLKPGELIYKHKSGTFFKFYEDGHIQVFTQDKLQVNTTQDCDITVLQGNLNATVNEGNAVLTTLEGYIQAEAKVGAINVIADEGLITVLAKVGNVAVTALEGAVEVTATAGPVSVSAGTSIAISSATTCTLTAGGIVTINAPGIDLQSAIIDAGSGALQALCNATFLTLFNAHQHVSGSAGTLTSSPTTIGVLGIATTVSLTAS